MPNMNEELKVRRFVTMKERTKISPADRLMLDRHHIRQTSDHYNHAACMTEHMWYVARALERIERHVGVTEEKKHPTANGRKDGPERNKVHE